MIKSEFLARKAQELKATANATSPLDSLGRALHPTMTVDGVYAPTIFLVQKVYKVRLQEIPGNRDYNVRVKLHLTVDAVDTRSKIVITDKDFAINVAGSVVSRGMSNGTSMFDEYDLLQKVLTDAMTPEQLDGYSDQNPLVGDELKALMTVTYANSSGETKVVRKTPAEQYEIMEEAYKDLFMNEHCPSFNVGYSLFEGNDSWCIAPALVDRVRAAISDLNRASAVYKRADADPTSVEDLEK